MRSPFWFTVSVIALLFSTVAKPEELSNSSSDLALSYQSSRTAGCLTLAAARSMHRRNHLYWHGPGHCWDATPTRTYVARARAPKPEHLAAASRVEHVEPPSSFRPLPFADEGRPENHQIAMIADYLAFDMVVEEWRQMSRGLVTPLVDKRMSEFDQRWSSTDER
jgi:hypothetical protein